MANTAAEKAREIWLMRGLRVQTKALKEIRQLLMDTARSLDRDLRTVNVGSARELQLREARIAIARELARMWTEVGNVVRANRELSIAEAVRSTVEWDTYLVDRSDMDYATKLMLKKGMKATAERNVEMMIRRFQSDNLDLSRRVYRSQALSSGWVDRAINVGIGEGLSAYELAKSVKHMIRPDTPGGVAYAAKRLARTELNMAFHQAQMVENSGKPWVEGIQWRLSKSHGQVDICDLLARKDEHGLGKGVYPKNLVPEIPHPQCLCFKVPKTEEPDDFVKSFLRGNYDQYLSEKYGI